MTNRTKDLAKHRVLIVDNNSPPSSKITRCLVEEGYMIKIVNHGYDALSASEEWLPSLILLAISLPDTDGVYICNQLRANERTEQIPIIFLTQKSDPMVNHRKAKLRATDDYIAKPLDSEELKLRVRKAIEETLNLRR
ncbi:MAG: response regulator [Chloroflexi bacterium]|nr:response regulator [Chloroflexota bacterium]